MTTLAPTDAKLPLSYVLPLRTDDVDLGDLPAYLRSIADVVAEVIVVDGSEPDVRAAHAAAVEDVAIVCAPEVVTPMGKVGGVLTGLRRAQHEHAVIADDDVRYEPEQLVRLDELLRDADVVRPQNYFDPVPWHARFDTARTLLNRVLGGDWPGTLALRRSALLRAGGYAGDVLFENLELVRTVEAAGGREVLALDLLVRRLPPTTAHFRGQQVRQAYDELARPGRLVASLAVAPLVASALRRGRTRPVLVAAAASVAVAEVGRRRAGGAARYPASSALLAPPWLVWRSLCSWAALGSRLRGGVVYRDGRLRRAATPRRALARRVRSAGR